MSTHTTYQPVCDVSVSRLLGLKSFANFLVVWVSVSDNLVSKKKVSVSVSENLVSEKSLSNGIDKFGLIRKVSVSVLENLVLFKKSRYHKKLSRIKSLGLGKNFGLVTQWYQHIDTSTYQHANTCNISHINVINISHGRRVHNKKKACFMLDSFLSESLWLQIDLRIAFMSCS